MGRRRQNPKKLDATGAYLQNPSRKPKNFDPLAPEPQPLALTPPSRLSAEQKEIWQELAAQANPTSITVPGDAQLFEVLVSLMHNFRTGKSYNVAQLTSLVTRFLKTSQPATAAPVSQHPLLDAFLSSRKNAA